MGWINLQKKKERRTVQKLKRRRLSKQGEMKKYSELYTTETESSLGSPSSPPSSPCISGNGLVHHVPPKDNDCTSKEEKQFITFGVNRDVFEYELDEQLDFPLNVV